MKISTVIISSLLAISASAFDKCQRKSSPTSSSPPAQDSPIHSIAWGKRDYFCITIYQGIPDNSTVAPGTQLELRFNRAPTTHCPNPLTQYPGSDYKVLLYNDPVRGPNYVTFDQSIMIHKGIKEEDGKATLLMQMAIICKLIGIADAEFV